MLLNNFLLNLGFNEKAKKELKKFNNRLNKEIRRIKSYFYLDL